MDAFRQQRGHAGITFAAALHLVSHMLVIYILSLIHISCSEEYFDLLPGQRKRVILYGCAGKTPVLRWVR